MHGLGAMIKRVEGGVRLVAEQYGNVKKTLDIRTKTFGAHTEMIARIAAGSEIIKSDAVYERQA